MNNLVVTIERNQRMPRMPTNPRTIAKRHPGYRAGKETTAAGEVERLVAVPPNAAMILGGAASVWRDVAVLETLVGGPWPGLVIAINDVGCQWPRRLDHWVTIHAEKLFLYLSWKHPNGGRNGWVGLREHRGLPGGYELWSTGEQRNWRGRIDHIIRQWGSGSSGLLAVAAAYHLGCPKVVLCGCPMDDRPHFQESVVHDARLRWSSVRSHRGVWERNLKRLEERTRSLSGWTRKQLGKPTVEWLTS